MSYDSQGREIHAGDTVILLGPDEEDKFHFGFNEYMEKFVGTEYLVKPGDEARDRFHIYDTESIRSWSWPPERTTVIDKTPILVTEEDLQQVFQ